MKRVKASSKIKKGKIKEFLYKDNYIKKGEDFALIETTEGDVLVKAPFSGTVIEPIDLSKKIKRKTTLAYIIPEDFKKKYKRRINEGSMKLDRKLKNDIFSNWKYVEDTSDLDDDKIILLEKNKVNSQDNNKKTNQNIKNNLINNNDNNQTTIKNLNDQIDNENAKNLFDRSKNLINLSDIKKNIEAIKKTAISNQNKFTNLNKSLENAKNSELKPKEFTNEFSRLSDQFKKRRDEISKSKTQSKNKIVNSIDSLDEWGKPNIFRNIVFNRMNRFMADNSNVDNEKDNKNKKTKNVDFNFEKDFDDDKYNFISEKNKDISSKSIIEDYIDKVPSEEFQDSKIFDHKYKSYSERLKEKILSNKQKIDKLKDSNNPRDLIKLRMHRLQLGEEPSINNNKNTKDKKINSSKINVNNQPFYEKNTNQNNLDYHFYNEFIPSFTNPQISNTNNLAMQKENHLSNKNQFEQNYYKHLDKTVVNSYTNPQSNSAISIQNELKLNELKHQSSFNNLETKINNLNNKIADENNKRYNEVLLEKIDNLDKKIKQNKIENEQNKLLEKVKELELKLEKSKNFVSQEKSKIIKETQPNAIENISKSDTNNNFSGLMKMFELFLMQNMISQMNDNLSSKKSFNKSLDLENIQQQLSKIITNNNIKIEQIKENKTLEKNNPKENFDFTNTNLNPKTKESIKNYDSNELQDKINEILKNENFENNKVKNDKKYFIKNSNNILEDDDTINPTKDTSNIVFDIENSLKSNKIPKELKNNSQEDLSKNTSNNDSSSIIYDVMNDLEVDKFNSTEKKLKNNPNVPIKNLVKKNINDKFKNNNSKNVNDDVYIKNLLLDEKLVDTKSSDLSLINDELIKLEELEVDDSLNVFNNINYQNVKPKTYTIKANVSKLLKLQNILKNNNLGIEFSIISFIIKAISLSLKFVPEMNTVFDIKNKEQINKKTHNIGLATETSDGIVIPVIRFADKLNMKQTAANVQELIYRLKNNELFDYELYGSTIILSSSDIAKSNIKFDILSEVSALIGMENVKENVLFEKGKVVKKFELKIFIIVNSNIISDNIVNRFNTRLNNILENPSMIK